MKIAINEQATESNNYKDFVQGYYPCRIEKVEEKQNKKGNGRWVLIHTEVIGGEFKGRKLWDYITYEHVKPEVAEKGINKISLLAKALNFKGPSMGLQDLEAYVTKLVGVHIKTVTREGEKQDIVINYKNVTEIDHVSASKKTHLGQGRSQQAPAYDGNANQGGFIEDPMNFS